MNMYHWRIVNKHGEWAFIANNSLTRNSSTLGPLEPNVQPRFYRISSVSEHEQMHDRSMLVLYLAFHGSKHAVWSVHLYFHTLSGPCQNDEKC